MADTAARRPATGAAAQEAGGGGGKVYHPTAFPAQSLTLRAVFDDQHHPRHSLLHDLTVPCEHVHEQEQ